MYFVVDYSILMNVLRLILAEIVAQLYTVLIMPSGVNLVTGLPFVADKYQSENSITDPELKVRFGDNTGDYLARQSACIMFHIFAVSVLAIATNSKSIWSGAVYYLWFRNFCFKHFYQKTSY